MSSRWWSPLSSFRRSSTRLPEAAEATALAGPAAPGTPAAEPSAPARSAHAPPHDAALHARFVGWLLAEPASGVDSVGETAQAADAMLRLWKRLDEVAASPTLRAALLPRAPHVVPQLMKTLRDGDYSSVDVASRISRDVVLSAEVIRSASSAYQRCDDGGEGEIDLARAVTIIGTQGLRRAIASVVLKPIFDGRGGTLSARAAAQIWLDADRKARLCAVLASEGDLDPFDGYLAGLLHNTGWTAALRAIDDFAPELTVTARELARVEVVPLLEQRCDALFGALVGPWQLSRAVDGLAAELGRESLAAATSPLAASLREAVRLSAWHALLPAGHLPAASVPDWDAVAQPVQDCYRALSRG